MNTRCPHCQTSYTVDAEILRQAQGMARCFNCGKVFDAFANSIAPTTPEPEPESEPEPEETLPESEPESVEPPGRLPDPLPEHPVGSTEALDSEALFSLSEEFELIKVDDSAALDMDDAFSPGRRSRTPLWQILVGILLALLLLAQLAWWQRAKLASSPMFEPVCRVFDCSEPPKRDPKMFRIVERSLNVSQSHPGALRLKVRLSNNATFAQPLPKMVISLSSITGQTLIRRTLAPSKYMFPAPGPGYLVRVGGVIDIDLLFKDPGVRADSFTLDFR